MTCNAIISALAHLYVLEPDCCPGDRARHMLWDCFDEVGEDTLHL